jgi:hypothetical protein
VPISQAKSPPLIRTPGANENSRYPTFTPSVFASHSQRRPTPRRHVATVAPASAVWPVH